MTNTDVLYKLLHLEKIYRDEIDKDADDYLNFLTKKISWFILNPTKEFYCRDYHKKASRMRPWKSKYIKLKYFYHWKFPPKYKDSEIPEVPLNEETGKLINGEIITEENFGEKRIKSLLKRGFIQKIEYSDMKKHKHLYESTGISLKYYRGIDESTLAGYQTDYFRIFNLGDEELIIDLEKLDSSEKVFMLRHKELHNLFLSMEKSKRKDLSKSSESFNKVNTGSILLKPETDINLSALVVFDGINIPEEVFRLSFKGKITEKTIPLPAREEYDLF